jgi:hypothetical protein
VNDFKQLFQFLHQINRIKEQWRKKASEFLQQQATESRELNQDLPSTGDRDNISILKGALKKYKA